MRIAALFVVRVRVMGSGLLPSGSSATNPSNCMNLRLSALHDWALTLALTVLHARSSRSADSAETPITIMPLTSRWFVFDSSSRSSPN